MLCTSTTLLVFTKITCGPCSGTIPTEIGMLRALTCLQLHRNKLKGRESCSIPWLAFYFFNSFVSCARPNPPTASPTRKFEKFVIAHQSTYWYVELLNLLRACWSPHTTVLLTERGCDFFQAAFHHSSVNYGAWPRFSYMATL